MEYGERLERLETPRGLAPSGQEQSLAEAEGECAWLERTPAGFRRRLIEWDG